MLRRVDTNNSVTSSESSVSENDQADISRENSMNIQDNLEDIKDENGKWKILNDIIDNKIEYDKPQVLSIQKEVQRDNPFSHMFVQVRGDGNCFYTSFLTSYLHHSYGKEVINERWKKYINVINVDSYNLNNEFMYFNNKTKVCEAVDINILRVLDHYVSVAFEQYSETPNFENMQNFFNDKYIHLYMTYRLRRTVTHRTDLPRCHGEDANDEGEEQIYLTMLFQIPIINVINNNKNQPYIYSVTDNSELTSYEINKLPDKYKNKNNNVWLEFYNKHYNAMIPT